MHTDWKRGSVRLMLAALTLAGSAVLSTAAPTAARGQSTVERSPNLSAGWISQSGIVQFNLVHRFSESGPPARKVASSPSFLVGVGLPSGDARFAVGAGGSARILDGLAVVGDWISLLDRRKEEDAAWGVGVQFTIPYTPHSVSLHATNANTATLEGSSRGTGRVRYGFEFTIPVTLRRYFRSEPVSPPVAATGSDAKATAAADEVHVAIKDFEFEQPRIEVPVGTTIVWTNRGQVVHTATGYDKSWDSGLLEPGESWRRTFDRPGGFAYYCMPHPFMKAVIIVTPGA